MPNYLQLIEREALTWDDVTSAPHRFSAKEFNLNHNGQTIEIGHLHNGTLLDILFSVKVRQVLVEAGHAKVHHILPDTGWMSFAVKTDDDVQHAIWLLRLSYLQKLYRASRHQADILEEVQALDLSDTLLTVTFPNLQIV